MSNEAYLIASNKTGAIKFDLRKSAFTWSEVVANSPMALPIGWMAFFDEACLIEEDEDDDSGPGLVSPMSDAVKRFKSRQKVILDAFPGFQSALASLLERLKARKMKRVMADVSELWGYDPDSFTSELKICLRWFEKPTVKGLEQLIAMSSIADYDTEKRIFAEIDPDVPREFHLVGYEYEVDPESPEEELGYDKKLAFDLDMKGLKSLIKKIEKVLPADSGFDPDDMMLDELDLLEDELVENMEGSCNLKIKKKNEVLTYEFSKPKKLFHVQLGGTPVVLDLLRTLKTD